MNLKKQLVALCVAIELVVACPIPASGQAANEVDVLKRFSVPPSAGSPRPGFPGGQFAPERSEMVVFVGQANFVREQKSGELESLLAAHFAELNLSFRSMAWEGDTVYEQWRDLNFGSWTAQLQAAYAGLIIAQFGQIEAIDGTARLPEFVAACHRLLDQFAAQTRRLVLVSPMPFEKNVEPHAPDLSQRNADVAAYASALREIARQRGAVFVDLFTPLSARSARAPRLTDNGMHLNAEGLRVVAETISRQLGVRIRSARSLAPLRTAIAEKNRLWADCWRPANWNFAYGDRITQPFGKPSVTSASLKELFEQHKTLIAAADARIHGLARGNNVPSPPPITPSDSANTNALSPEAELATFTLADGYQVNLFASERDGVVKPTQIAWDERGRLYVCCSPTYPHVRPGQRAATRPAGRGMGATLLGDPAGGTHGSTLASTGPGDFILVCEDTNGDGQADKLWRFAEGLTMVEGIEPGDGGVYVCDFDELIHLRDTNGDGRADQRRVIFSGFGTGDTHQLINSITHGPDGSLWFTQGLHVMSRIETPWGLSRLDHSGVWRLNPRTLRLDAFFNGAKAGHNCWGVAFDDFGQVFHKSGDRPQGYWSVPGMVRLANPDEYHPVGPLFDTSPKTTALDIIGTRALPDDVQGCAVIGGYFGSVVELHRFQDDDSGFKTTQLPKLLKSSTTSFRPVDVSVGPDGAIYLADWFNPIIGHYQASYADPNRDKTHGRIWRITATGRAPVKQPNLAAMKLPQLLDQLRSPERWTRQQAKRLLFAAPSDKVLKAPDTWLARLDPGAADYEHLLLEVCGVFEAHQAIRPDLLAKLLVAKDPRVRAYGTRVVGAWAERLPDALSLLRARARDEHPRVRLEAVVAASYVPRAEAVESAALVLDAPRDKFINYALAQTIRALKPQWQPALAAGRINFGGLVDHRDFVIKSGGAVDSEALKSPGQKIYDALCLNCHQPGGTGLPGVYPPLTGSEWITGPKQTLIKMLLHGARGPMTVGDKTFNNFMPPSGLNDRQIADVLTYVRSSFGNAASEVTPNEVASLRAASAARQDAWSVEELNSAKNP